MVKIAAITGAYKGLGAAISRLLAQKGYWLVLGGKDKDKLEKFGEEIKSITKVITVLMDVRIKKDCEKLIEDTIKAFGKIDILINNAGVWKSSNIEEVSEEEVREMFEVNIFGPIYCSQAAVKAMKKQNGGGIINIGSTAAIDYKVSHIAYGSSKAALIGFTGCLKTELQGTGIKISVFSPGGMKTELFRSKPERLKDDFMDPNFVAEKIVQHIENPTDEWHIILRRPK